ncbi:MAG: PRC-barrel domain-containing protein [Gaiellaceae bacterium]
MLETYSQEELTPLVGHEVVDANGKSVGYVDLLFADDATGRPEWLGLWNGVWGTRPRVLVPLRGVELVEDELRIPWTDDVVKDAPTYDEEDDRGLFGDDSDAIGISPAKEREAYAHYGVEPLAAAPEGDRRVRFRALVIDLRAPGATRG